jgi:hypothetical protein
MLGDLAQEVEDISDQCSTRLRSMKPLSDNSTPKARIETTLKGLHVSHKQLEVAPTQQRVAPTLGYDGWPCRSVPRGYKEHLFPDT